MANDIKQIINSLSKLINDSEKISLSSFSHKLEKASAAYPEDRTIGMMLDVVSRMAGNKKTFITRAEIKDLYNKLYSRNTKFADLFKDEVGQVEKLAAKTYDRKDNDEDLSVFNKISDSLVDPTLVNALDVAFGNEVKGYSKSNAQAAKAMCQKTCSSPKLEADVSVANGNSDVMICSVAFETPKGKVSVFVPVEFAEKKPLLPSIFVGNNGVEKLSKTNLSKYVKSQAGKKLNMTADIVFGAIKSAKNANVISGVDLALTKLNAEKEDKADYAAGGVYFQKLDAENKNLVVKTATYKDDEFETFSKKFDSSLGVAAFKFGEDKIKLGRKLLVSKLESFGLKNSQIAVCDSDVCNIVYAVSLDSGKVAFRVPVRVQDNKLLAPELLICNGMVDSLSKEGVQSLYEKNSIDYKTAAFASPLYGLKPSELVQILREAMAEQNFFKAEDTLTVLAETGDEKAYKVGFEIYAGGLNIVKSADKTAKCSMIVKSSSSQHPVCGHTGLPLHKTFVDKNGNCRPAYRQGMQDTNEGAYFMNSKIFV
jgi:hypothetical protein